MSDRTLRSDSVVGCGRLRAAAVAAVAVAVAAAACAGRASPSPDGDAPTQPTPVSTSTRSGDTSAEPEHSCGVAGARVGVLEAGATSAVAGATASVFTQSTGIAVDLIERDARHRSAGRRDSRADAVAFGPLALDDWQRSGLLVADVLDEVVGDSPVPAGLVDAAVGWLAPAMSLVVFTVGDSVERAPASFAELAADRTLTIGLAGDPRRSEAGLAAVIAASVANGGNIGDAIPGIDWFAERADEGRLVRSSPDVLIGLSDGVSSAAVVPADAVVGWPALVGLLDSNDDCAAAWLRYLTSADAARRVAAAGLLPSIWATPASLGRVAAGQRRLLPAPPALSRLNVIGAEDATLASEAVRDAWADRVRTGR